MGKAKQEITEEEGIADVMAWGSYKDNYYKNSEDEYSSLEEEEQEALKIYENQFKILNDQEIYELPQEASKEGSGSEDSEDGLSFEYLIG